MKNRGTIEQKKTEVLAHLINCYGVKTVACRKCKIGRTQFYEWMKEDIDFALKVQEIEDSFLDMVEFNLIEMIQLKDRAAIMFYLKAKGKSRGY